MSHPVSLIPWGRGEGADSQGTHLGVEGGAQQRQGFKEVQWCGGFTQVGSRVPPQLLSHSPFSNEEKIRHKGLKT